MKTSLPYFVILFLAAFIVLLLVNDKTGLTKKITQNTIDTEKMKIDSVTRKDTVLVNTENIIFIITDKVELKNKPDTNSITVDYIRVNSIFYIRQRSSLAKITIGKKIVEDFWYLIDDYKGTSGWVFGYFTSKTLNPIKQKNSSSIKN